MMRGPILRLLLMALVAVLILLAVPLGKFALYEKFGDNNYVTSAGSGFCYISGRENKNIRSDNKLFYSTIELCGKPLKK